MEDRLSGGGDPDNLSLLQTLPMTLLLSRATVIR